MALNLEQKTTIITDYKLHEKDTGSSEVQIARPIPKTTIHGADSLRWSANDESFWIT